MISERALLDNLAAAFGLGPDTDVRGYLVRRLNDDGLDGVARELGMSRGAVHYWTVKLGVARRWVVLEGDAEQNNSQGGSL